MANPSTSLPLTRESVFAAHELVKPYIHYTPVVTSTTLTELASTPQTAEILASTPWAGQKPAQPVLRLWFKCENQQRGGAFKARGAFHAIQRLMAGPSWEESGGRQAGVVTHSSGNHGQALALAARTMGVPAHIVMPAASTPTKIAAARGYGARVVFCGNTLAERETVLLEVMKETGARFVPPFDHPDISLGQGTLGLEMQEQVEDLIAAAVRGERSSITVPDGSKASKGGLHAIMTPVGGGGMLSGTAISAEGTGIVVFGAEPEFEGADDCKRGLESGTRIEAVNTSTIADGLRTSVGKVPWTVIHDRKLVRQVFSVTEEQIKKALRLVLERMKVFVEPSAVVPLAVVLYNEDFRRLVEKEAGGEGWDLGLVFSGGNTNMEALAKLFAPAL